jgi:hypothetical protein
MKKTIGFVLALMLSFSGCRKTPEPTPEPKPEERPKIQLSFRRAAARWRQYQLWSGRLGCPLKPMSGGGRRER